MLAHIPTPLLPRYALPGLFLAAVVVITFLGGLIIHRRTDRIVTCVQVTEDEGARKVDAVRICVDGVR